MAMVQKSYSNFLNEGAIANQYSLDSIIEEFEKLKSYIADKFADFDINNISFKENIQNKLTLISLPPSIFFLIANQFIENSISAYRKYRTDVYEREISFLLFEDKDHIRFELINNGPIIPENILSILGYKPVSGSLSSGLGYYFLNFSLNLSGAEKLNGLFFKIKNISKKQGVQLTFKFKKLNEA